MVFPENVIAFRPCEMLVFRRPGSNRLTYGGAATAWDPPKSDREAMRNAAKRVGAHLRNQYGYRGVFTIDGIMTKNGFLPTELNPRFGAAISRMTSQLPNLPLFLLHRALCEGVELDYRPHQLEEMVIEGADATRVIQAGFSVPGVNAGNTPTRRYRLTDTGWEENAENWDASIIFGPAAFGSYLAVSIKDGVLPAGHSPAKAITELLHQSNDDIGHGLIDLEPAIDVRG
jgi:hypothetical protein